MRASGTLALMRQTSGQCSGGAHFQGLGATVAKLTLALGKHDTIAFSTWDTKRTNSLALYRAWCSSSLAGLASRCFIFRPHVHNCPGA
jgi:hypothetical protein